MILANAASRAQALVSQPLLYDPRENVQHETHTPENYRRVWELIEEVSAVNRELLRERLVEPAEGTARTRSRKRSG
jgi:hypothetical protein